MKLLQPLVRRTPALDNAERFGVNEYAQMVAQSFGFGGTQYPLGVSTTVPGVHTEPIGTDFCGYVNKGLKGNSIIWTLESARIEVFSQARFQFRRLTNGRPGDLFGTTALVPLEQPYEGGTTGKLLARMLLDADLAGNSYSVLYDGGVVRLRPDWVDIVLKERTGPVGNLGHDIAGYVYWPDGQRDHKHPTGLLPHEVAHFAPKQDPLATHRGMSWLTPVVRDLMGDNAYTEQKLSYLGNAATPNLAVTLKDAVDPETFLAFVDAMDAAHKGPENAGKTLYMAAGADVTVIGSDMQSLDFKAVQGATETRLAAASGVGAVIAQLSEGMQGSSLNAGNYAASRRRFADMTMRHLWQEAAGALQTIIAVPADAHLWYDARDIPFLQEDEADAANIRSIDATTIRTLIEGGFDADAAVAFVQGAGDLSQLTGAHSGLLSVQLQDPTAIGADASGPPAATAAGEADKQETARGIAEMVQKIYLGIGKVISAEEARTILNRAGAGLPAGDMPVDPTATPPVPAP